MWIVWSRESAAVELAVAALDERPDADEHAQDVVAGGRLAQVPAGRLEDELDLLLAAAAARASASSIGVSVVPTSV